MNADNLIVLNGRLTKDVDLRYLQDGKAFGGFTVATNRAYKNKDGQYDADFHNCVAFGKTAETIANYFSKGSMIGIVGEYQDNNYTNKEGVTVYSKQVKVDSFGFREKKQNSSQHSEQTQNSNPFDNNSSHIDISDESLPF